MHMKTLIFTFFLFTNISIAQEQLLSEKSQISVLTVGPGTALNDAFGHTAFRIKDELLGIDVTYGYGEYDFNTPDFYLKFAKGKLDYLISKVSFKRFYHVYRHYYNRRISEQVLNLSHLQKQKLFNHLINNYKPENRAYSYDFFFNNCATKIKEIIQISTNNSVTFNKPNMFKETTYRTLIQQNLNSNSWGSLGIDVALGSVIDITAQPEDHMFLPENIHAFFQIATCNDSQTPLVKTNHVLYNQKEVHNSSSFVMSPYFIMACIGFVILYITFHDFRKQKRSKWLDVLLFSITGVVGILLMLLWFATDHEGTQHNYNLLWACALNSFMIGQLMKKKAARWFSKYIAFLILMLCLMILHWMTGVQVFALGLIPFLIALFVRYLFLIDFYNKAHQSS